MRQSTIYILSLISLSNLINAGVIRERSTCYDDKGQEIPCRKVVDKKQDFDNSNLSKRQWGFGRWGRKNNYNQNSWWPSRWNTANTNNAASANVPVSNAVATNKFEDDGLWNMDNSWDIDNSRESNGIFGKLFDTSGIWDWFNRDSGDDWSWSNLWNGGNDVNTWDNENIWGPPNGPEISTKTIPEPLAPGQEPGPSPASGPIPGIENSPKTIPEEPPVAPNTVPAPNPVSVPVTNPEPAPAPVSNPEPIPASIPETAPETAPAPSNSASSSPEGKEALPIKKFEMTTFGNCDQQQSNILKNLIEDIKTYRAAAVYLLENQSEDDMYRKIFEKYFKDTAVLSRVKQVFNDVNGMTSAEAYCETMADDACADGAMAWTYLRSGEFHVCPSFFSEAMFGTIEQRASEASSIVLHELTHCKGTDDYAYGENGVNQLNPSYASNNADTYRLFSMSSIYYLNEKNGLAKRDDDSFLNESIDFHDEPFKDMVFDSKLAKRNFYSEQIKDKVVIRPVKRNAEDFLNESIDFKNHSFTDMVKKRPNQA